MAGTRIVLLTLGLLASLASPVGLAQAVREPAGGAKDEGGLVGPPAPREGGYHPEIDAQLNETRRDVREARERGQLSRKQARDYRKQAGRVSAAANRARRQAGGMSASEARDFDMQARMLDSMVNAPATMNGSRKKP
ncbi:hypothetical protein I5E68_18115 [Novosphingobium sp. YJ-S2-02]|uniref:DUF4148 domain-containing protein n=1 Tax=Novosphingobium aureum TaxID=2792964 RepID=A0A931HGB3_9SPHN|nr:hypothetical protein [Novosphingobium aureum]MBH0114868.1 hypothetical protein [Novosphingobium aureum]